MRRKKHQKPTLKHKRAEIAKLLSVLPNSIKYPPKSKKHNAPGPSGVIRGRSPKPQKPTARWASGYGPSQLRKPWGEIIPNVLPSARSRVTNNSRPMSTGGVKYANCSPNDSSNNVELRGRNTRHWANSPTAMACGAQATPIPKEQLPVDPFVVINGKTMMWVPRRVA